MEISLLQSFYVFPAICHLACIFIYISNIFLQWQISWKFSFYCVFIDAKINIYKHISKFEWSWQIVLQYCSVECIIFKRLFFFCFMNLCTEKLYLYILRGYKFWNSAIKQCNNLKLWKGTIFCFTHQPSGTLQQKLVQMNWIQKAFAKKLVNYLLFHARVADENRVSHCKAFAWNVLDHRYKRNKTHSSEVHSVPFVKKLYCHISKNKQWKAG